MFILFSKRRKGRGEVWENKNGLENLPAEPLPPPGRFARPRDLRRPPGGWVAAPCLAPEVPAGLLRKAVAAGGGGGGDEGVAASSGPPREEEVSLVGMGHLRAPLSTGPVQSWMGRRTGVASTRPLLGNWWSW